MKKKKQKPKLVEHHKYDEEGDPIFSRFSRDRRVNRAWSEVDFNSWHVNQCNHSDKEKSRL